MEFNFASTARITPSPAKLGLLNGALGSRLNFPLCLAPMVGLTHVALRLVLREYLPASAFTIWPTEMLNSRKLPFEDLNSTPEALRDPREEGLVPQILGNDESCIAQSLLKLEAWGAEGIDINMGCPVEKALRHNYGVALMGDAKYAADVVRMTVKSTQLPVSVKLRAIQREDSGKAELLDFVAGLQAAGASWITLHPRTAEQKRRGQAEWSQISWLKKNLSIPVIGNGDIQTLDDVVQMQEETGCDLVMAGRALAARPWMLWQLGEQLGFGPPAGREGESAPRTTLEEGREYGRVLRRHLAYCLQFFKEDLALRKFRFYVRTTAVWLSFGHTLYSVVTKAKTPAEILEALDLFFAHDIEMSERTELRQ